MKFNKSIYVQLTMLSTPFFFLGIMIFVDPTSVDGRDITQKVGYQLLLSALLIVAVSFLLFFATKFIRTWLYPSGSIPIKVFSDSLIKHLLYGFILLLFTLFLVFTEPAVTELPKKIGYIFGIAIMACAFMWMSWTAFCAGKFISLAQSKKMITTAKLFAPEFAFEDSMEKQFDFPQKYFDFGKNGVAEYQFKKTISGVHLRLFQYAQTQKEVITYR